MRLVFPCDARCCSGVYRGGRGVRDWKGDFIDATLAKAKKKTVILQEPLLRILEQLVFLPAPIGQYKIRKSPNDTFVIHLRSVCYIVIEQVAGIICSHYENTVGCTRVAMRENNR